jgi:hypothetical protein
MEKYPSIVQLPDCPEIFHVKEVIATEKLHGCVVAKTRVSMADGTTKSISTLSVGDEVLGVDTEGKVVSAIVTNTYNNGKAEKWVRVTGTRLGMGRGNHFFSIICTPEHHVWHPERGDYLKVSELQINDPVLLLRSEYGLTPLQEQTLIGKMLGDGSLAQIKYSANMSWGHKSADVEYLRWTSRALGELDSGTESPRTSGYGSSILARRTVNSPLIKNLLADFIGKDGVKIVPKWVSKRLTPITVAFWYMDDGTLIHHGDQEDRASFAVCGFNKSDCEVLVKGLARLGIGARYQRYSDGYMRIELSTDAAEALFLLVAPYIPPCMHRKLPERYRGHSGWLPSFESQYKPALIRQVITAIEETKVRSKRYDIETTTHNYIANGVLVHNSNFRLFFPLGIKSIEKIGYGSRDLEYGVGDQKFPLGSVVNKFKANPDLLGSVFEVIQSYGFSEVTVFGEAFGPGIKAKGVRYSTGQEPLFRAFDIMVAQNFVTYDLFCEICDKMRLPRVHEVWRGEPTQANFDSLLEKPSTEGLLNGFGNDNIAEGVVLRSNPLFRNVFGEWLICKHKNAKFAEVATAAVQKIPRGPTAADDFAAKYVTEGRVTNAIGRLHDSGTDLTNTMKDMPVLLGAVCADLGKDYPEEMAELGITEQSLKGNVSRILGPMYRGMLSKE